MFGLTLNPTHYQGVVAVATYLLFCPQQRWNELPFLLTPTFIPSEIVVSVFARPATIFRAADWSALLQLFWPTAFCTLRGIFDRPVVIRCNRHTFQQAVCHADWSASRQLFLPATICPVRQPRIKWSAPRKLVCHVEFCSPRDCLAYIGGSSCRFCWHRPIPSMCWGVK